MEQLGDGWWDIWLHSGGTRIKERRGRRWDCASTSGTGSVWKTVEVALIWYNSTIWHVSVLRWSTQGVNVISFRGLIFACVILGPCLYTGAHQGWWGSELETPRCGGSSSSPPDLCVLLIPSRLKARLLLDVSASLIREIILPSVNSWEGQRRRFPTAGAVPDFAESSIPIWEGGGGAVAAGECPQVSKFLSKITEIN